MSVILVFRMVINSRLRIDDLRLAIED